MRDYSRLQMSDSRRRTLIESHNFYVEQANSRLLSQFENMETEADEASKAWLESSAQYFDPDRDDEGSFYQRADDVGIQFFQLLDEMRKQTRLSVVAGMFQLWDKQLRMWLVSEMARWHRGEKAPAKVRSADFGMIGDLLESLGWQLKSTAFYQKLDECRLVVNVYKHGDGKSLEELKSRFPPYLLDPHSYPIGRSPNLRFRDHTHLQVSDADIEMFATAIVEFWRGAPEDVLSSQVTTLPSWFGNVLLKDKAR